MSSSHENLSASVPMAAGLRVGQGFDVHPWSKDPSRVLVLGGVSFPGFPGLAGHSDADVIAHAATDAILGAAGLGDIGSFFPDTDEAFAGANSIALLGIATQRLADQGWQVVNIDCTVICDAPSLAPVRDQIINNMSGAVGAPVSVKGKRTEGVEGACRRRAMPRRSTGGIAMSGRNKPKSSKGARPAGSRNKPGSGAKGNATDRARDQSKHRAQVRRGLGGDQVEGRQAVRELLLAGTRKTREVVMIEDMDNAPILDDIVELAQDMNVPLRYVTRRKFDGEALTESHQGVVARAFELPETELEKLARRKGAFLLLLDGVTDPGNLGAMLRTAECAGVTGIVLPRHRSVHITPTVTKTAAGAVEFLPMALVGGLPAAIARLKELDVMVVGLDMGGERSVFDMPVHHEQPIALVLGAEGKGLSRLVRERCDTIASIPMRGELNSLNVAMAAGVACFEVVRRQQELAAAADAASQ
ncbi:MAG: 23S rRNA (guanosine(2251)-2'-O)-methyltransferase RlmB [Acidimicrobiales bacterium]